MSGDSKFVPGISLKPMMCGKRIGNLDRCFLRQAASDTDGSQLPLLIFGMTFEFALLAKRVSRFTVGLAANRDKFTRCHRHRPGHDSCHTGKQ